MKTKPKTRTPTEWIDEYERRTGGKFQPDPAEFILFSPQHGIATFFRDEREKCLECHYMVGDGKFWSGEIKKIVWALGYDKAHFFTRRNPKAWIRKYGGHIRGWYMEVSVDESKI